MEARKSALEILLRVFRDDGYASLIMREARDIDPEDMAFVSNLVYGTIRNYSYLESQWRPYAKKVKLKTALLLDMTIYEMLYMKTPDYAAVNNANELAVSAEKKFVNAILRRFQKEGEITAKNVADETSHPAWIAGMWKAHYGEETAEKIMRADQEIPETTGRINPLKMSKEELEKDEAVHFIDDLSFTMDTPIQKTTAFLQGRVLIQNPSSILPVDYLDLEEGMKVLDLCAAPGTKTQLIAARMKNTGSVTACDLYPNRVSLIDQLMVRTGVTNVTTQVNDATEDSFEHEAYDRVLCDVPCSGLGDLRHKPEIRWHLTPQDIDEIIGIQKKILETASAYVRDGGILVYSTCTLNKKENEKQVASFLKDHPEFTLKTERTVFPFEAYHDGFYAAALVKTHGDMVE